MADEWQPSQTGLSGLRRKLGVLVFADGPSVTRLGRRWPDWRSPRWNCAKRITTAPGTESGAADVIMFVFDHSRNI